MGGSQRPSGHRVAGTGRRGPGLAASSRRLRVQLRASAFRSRWQVSALPRPGPLNLGGRVHSPRPGPREQSSPMRTAGPSTTSSQSRHLRTITADTQEAPGLRNSWGTAGPPPAITVCARKKRTASFCSQGLMSLGTYELHILHCLFRGEKKRASPAGDVHLRVQAHTAAHVTASCSTIRVYWEDRPGDRGLLPVLRTKE